MVDHCIVCGAVSKSRCSRCKLTSYCSPKHQKEHWAQHKHICKPYEEASDNVVGRYLVATQNIEPDQVIFVEDPLVVGPKWYYSDEEKHYDFVPCVGCYKPCSLGKHFCSRCKWPACSKSCKRLKCLDAHGVECVLLSIGPGPKTKSDMQNYYRQDALLVLRCLLLQYKDPHRWNALLDMQSHDAERIGTELYNDAEERVVDYLEQNILRHLKKYESQSKYCTLTDYRRETLHRICGIIETNYMCIQLPTGIELSGIFRMACMMEHSCQPNVYFHFDSKRDCRISVMAGGNIKPGEHLKIAYTNILWGTQMRNRHLAMTKHFCCRCVRCCDPTECGTYFSALRCLGDVNTTCDGLQLPQDPLNEESVWKCNKCPVVIDGGYVTNLLNQINEDVDTLLANRPTVSDVESMIERLSKLLHPNHFHMLNLKHTLVQLYGSQEGYEMAALSAEQLDNKEKISRRLYAVCEKLDPYMVKLSIYGAILLYERERSLKECARRLIEVDNKSDAVELVNLARKLLLKATKLLHKELDTVAGKKLDKKVNEESIELDIFGLMHQIM